MPTLPNTNLQPGMTGPQVTQLQQWLIANGFNVPSGATGYYGSETKAAVAALQSKYNVQAGTNAGFFGPQTIAAVQAQTPQSGSMPGRVPGASTSTPSASYTTQVADLSRGGAIFSSGQDASYFVQLAGQDDPNVGGAPDLYKLDPSTKTLHPFTVSEYKTWAAGKDENAIRQYIKTVAPDVFAAGGVLAGYSLVTDPSYSVKADGTHKKYLDPTVAQVTSNYGKAEDASTTRNAFSLVQKFVNSLSTGAGGVSSDFIRNIAQDPVLLRGYVNAIGYGGYTINDVFGDIKKRELMSTGDTSMSEVAPISLAYTKEVNANTPEYKKFASNNALQLTADSAAASGDFNSFMQIADLPIFRMDPSVFGSMSDLLSDPNSAAYKEAASKIQTSYYDIMEMMYNANTEQEKAVADAAYDKFRKDAAKTLGVQLSNNAFNAWPQIESIQNNMAGRNIAGSGIEAETIDDYLRTVRRSDDQARAIVADQLVDKKYEYLSKYGSSEQIKQLAAENPTLARDLGLVPSDSAKAQLNMTALQAKYPNVAPEKLQQYLDSIIDSNGNYKSSLYSKQATNLLQNTYDKQNFVDSEVTRIADMKDKVKQEEFTSDPSKPFTTGTQNISGSTTVANIPTNVAQEVLTPTNRYTNLQTTVSSTPNQPAPKAASVPAPTYTPPKVTTPTPTIAPATKAPSVSVVTPTTLAALNSAVKKPVTPAAKPILTSTSFPTTTKTTTNAVSGGMVDTLKSAYKTFTSWF